MPKMRTNRMAAKKFRVGGKGSIKRGHARGNHNTGKKPASVSMRYRRFQKVEKANSKGLARMLPGVGL